MKLLVIRHSLAIEREEWDGHDFDRPLTEKGKKRAKRFFKHIKKIYPKIDYIVTSKASRAKYTAEILNSFYKTNFKETHLLYPGANFQDFKQAIENLQGVVAIVGHEPDLSEFIKDMMFAPNLKIKLKKPSLVEMEDGVLKALIDYKMFKEEND